jgi:hypothetical protein
MPQPFELSGWNTASPARRNGQGWVATPVSPVIRALRKLGAMPRMASRIDSRNRGERRSGARADLHAGDRARLS